MDEVGKCKACTFLVRVLDDRFHVVLPSIAHLLRVFLPILWCCLRADAHKRAKDQEETRKKAAEGDEKADGVQRWKERCLPFCDQRALVGLMVLHVWSKNYKLKNTPRTML